MRVVRTAGSAKPAPVDAAPAHRSLALATTTTSAAKAADTATVARPQPRQPLLRGLVHCLQNRLTYGQTNEFPKFSRTHTDRSGERHDAHRHRPGTDARQHGDAWLGLLRFYKTVR
jgi:hypothetical protein